MLTVKEKQLVKEYAKKLATKKKKLVESSSMEIGRLRDYLKSNCRSWEYDSDNHDDTMELVSTLQQRFPKIKFDDIFAIAKHWTGYEGDIDGDDDEINKM